MLAWAIIKSDNIFNEFEEFFLINNSTSFILIITFCIFFNGQFFICVFTISLSFQKIGGLKFLTTCSILLLLLISSCNLSILLALIKSVLTIKIQSSVEKLFSFKICDVFFVFFAKQLSVSSETL